MFVTKKDKSILQFIIKHKKAFKSHHSFYTGMKTVKKKFSFVRHKSIFTTNTH